MLFCKPSINLPIDVSCSLQYPINLLTNLQIIIRLFDCMSIYILIIYVGTTTTILAITTSAIVIGGLTNILIKIEEIFTLH